jgi:hypothetical protein
MSQSVEEEIKNYQGLLWKHYQKEIKEQESVVFSSAFVTDSTLLFSGSNYGIINVWEIGNFLQVVNQFLDY